MKKNDISLAILAALSTSGVLQTQAHAQGGVLIPESAPTPIVKTVSKVEHPVKKAAQTRSTMPVPHAARSMKATGHIVHVQKLQNKASNIGYTGPMPVVSHGPMMMGGFSPQLIEERPQINFGVAPKLMPSASPSSEVAPSQ